MERIDWQRPWSLHGIAASRRVEQAAAAALSPHTLMARAGLAVARLALAVAPHAQTIWVACGPGNNGGDGFEAARHLTQWGRRCVLTWMGAAERLPPDAQHSLQQAIQAGIQPQREPPPAWDLAVDALLGLGASRPAEGELAHLMDALNARSQPVLAVDLPSGLNGETGQGSPCVRATHTLSLLTLKPGLFTAQGRDHAGVVWLDTLDIDSTHEAPTAWLAGPAPVVQRPHDSHKGAFGDVAVIGGAPGMGGAAYLAAQAALHGGAGRVFVGCLQGQPVVAFEACQPELMWRPWDALDLSRMAVACGCGGGDAVRAALPRVLSTAQALVLDADALNAVATDSALQALLKARAGRANWRTVLTPHPLEAARLLGCDAAQVQVDRLKAAGELATAFGCVTVLKGSGTVVASVGRPPVIHPTGNGRLATAGTGDVLAGLAAARLAQGFDAFDAAHAAVRRHGEVADRWTCDAALTASGLARRLG